MRSKYLHSIFLAMRTLFVAFMALAGLILCLTVMHSIPAVANVNVGSGAAGALTMQHELPSAQSSGVLGDVATCQGPCGQEHFMMAATCAIALLVPLLLIGAARITAAWRPLAHRMQSLTQRVGAVAPSLPPSLLFLSISRT